MFKVHDKKNKTVSNDKGNIYLFKVNNRNTTKKVLNVFKVFNKDPRTTSILLWRLYC